MGESSARGGKFGNSLDTIVHGEEKCLVVHPFRIFANVNARLGADSNGGETTQLMQIEADIALSHLMLFVDHKTATGETKMVIVLVEVWKKIAR